MGDEAVEDAAGEIHAGHGRAGKLRLGEIAFFEEKLLLGAFVEHRPGQVAAGQLYAQQIALRQRRVAQTAVAEEHVPELHLLKGRARAAAADELRPGNGSVAEGLSGEIAALEAAVGEEDPPDAQVGKLDAAKQAVAKVQRGKVDALQRVQLEEHVLHGAFVLGGGLQRLENGIAGNRIGQLYGASLHGKVPPVQMDFFYNSRISAIGTVFQ